MNDDCLVDSMEEGRPLCSVLRFIPALTAKEQLYSEISDCFSKSLFSCFSDQSICLVAEWPAKLTHCLQNCAQKQHFLIWVVFKSLEEIEVDS